MAIGKKPSLNKVKEINLDSPEVQNFINSGVIGTAAEKNSETETTNVTEEVINKPEPDKKAESKRGRKSNTEAASIKYYNLPIPEDVFDGIEEYIFKKRKEKKVTIRGFIIDCIKKELGNENIL